MSLDIRLDEQFSIGLLASYEWLSTDTSFNGRGNDADGWTVGPYLAWGISDQWSLDANLGYSWLGNDQHRIDPQDASRLTAGFDSTRWSGAVNLSGWFEQGNWGLAPILGLLYTDEIRDA